MVAAVELALPFDGRWLVQNSPARRVPSHGVDVFGQRFAIDFIAVGDRGRTAATLGKRSRKDVSLACTRPARPPWLLAHPARSA